MKVLRITDTKDEKNEIINVSLDEYDGHIRVRLNEYTVFSLEVEDNRILADQIYNEADAHFNVVRN